MFPPCAVCHVNVVNLKIDWPRPVHTIQLKRKPTNEGEVLTTCIILTVCCANSPVSHLNK